MKSLMKFALIATLTALTVIGCSKSSGNSDVTATTALSKYSLSNGLCYDSNRQVVDSIYCMNISNYYQVNGYCYSTAGARVDDIYCRQNKSLTLPPRQCEGQFFIPRRNHRAEIRCHDRSCQGNLMFDHNGHPVHCR